MNYLDISICHKTVLKAFSNMPVVSLLQGVNLCNKVHACEKNHHFWSLSSSSIITLAFTHSEDISMLQ